MNACLRWALTCFAFVAITSQFASAQIIPAPPSAAADTFLPDSALPFLDFSQDWPSRWGAEKSPLRGVIVPLSAPASTFAVRSISSSSEKIAGDELDFTALNERFPGATKWAIEGKNASPVESRLKTPKYLRTGLPDASLVFKFVSGSVSDDKTAPLVIERTTFALYEPTGELKPTHLVVLLPGMFGTPEQIIEPLILHLRSHGIAVLRMFSHPSRFTEQLSFTIDLKDSSSLENTSKQVASSVNSRLAECAYAVDGAIQHVIDNRPLIATLPRVALGASGGAIVLPTVCALRPATWAGAVMIGGGADFWLINQRSNYQNLIKALKVSWTSAPSEDQRQLFDTLYLKHASLDSFHTAKSISNTPIFYIQGENDQAVPATLGDLLWTRIAPASPDSKRVSTPLTHEALFATLPARFDEIREWIQARKH